MQLNAAHVNLKEWKESKGTKSKEEEEDWDVMRKITIIEFTKPTGKKEQLESSKSREKSHNESKSVGKDMILEQQLEDSPPWHHSPLTNHYQNRICLSICNEQVKIITSTFNAKVMGMKLCSLSDVLHIFKELEYTLMIIPHPKEYHFIYHL